MNTTEASSALYVVHCQEPGCDSTLQMGSERYAQLKQGSTFWCLKGHPMHFEFGNDKPTRGARLTPAPVRLSKDGGEG